MQKWMLMRKGADFQHISEKFHITPWVASLIRNRGIIGDENIEKYLHGGKEDLYDGMLMKDMDKAISVLSEKIHRGEKIRIIGDYDIDGVQATYILLEGLEYLGAQVDSDIPERIKDGYGLNQNLLQRAYEDGIDTIITCDNGIAAKEEIAYAKSKGMTVIVTDHHEVPYVEVEGEKQYRLPEADAVIDPKRKDCPYPFKGLCGAAVAYKLVEAMVRAEGKDLEAIEYLLENVAFATVGDVVDLVEENRILVKLGLEILNHTKNKGLRALIKSTGLSEKKINPGHIGFVLGPCVNASGRLDTAKRSLALLRAKTKEEAESLAEDLKALNDSRKDMTAEALEEAYQQIETTQLKEDKVLVVYLPNCHESLAGIVAGRIREKYYKPALVFTKGESSLKGSGRSIDTWNLYEGLSRCAHLLIQFGGHAKAAGVHIEEQNLETFRRAINERSNLTEEDIVEKIHIDMVLPFEVMSEAFIEALDVLEPFGQGNTKPVFADKNVKVLRASVIGKNRNTLKLSLQNAAGSIIDGIQFEGVQEFFDYVGQEFGEAECEKMRSGQENNVRMAFIYYPEVNEYNGHKNLQIRIQKYK